MDIGLENYWMRRAPHSPLYVDEEPDLFSCFEICMRLLCSRRRRRRALPGPSSPRDWRAFVPYPRSLTLRH